MAVFPPAANLYAQWRSRNRAPDFLRDDSGAPTERLLQAIWQHQRLLRDTLKTVDGRSVRIFHPGFASVEGGPDFRRAVLQIGDELPISGDVEIDLSAAGWRAHGHDKNPTFKNVILHAVWDEVGVRVSARRGENKSAKLKAELQPAILPLKNSLDAPLAELSLSLEGGSLLSLPENLLGKCSAPLRQLDDAYLAELLSAAARVRFEIKAAQFRARARNSGWEQALWEGLFRALGYKHNVWPMQSLAEAKSLWSCGTNSVFEFQTRLLGVSGLLPDELTRSQKSSDTFLRRAWDIWWRERDGFENCILPRAVWKFHGLRPANHPQRRLALAAHWLADGNFVSKIEKWIAVENTNGRVGARLRLDAAARRPCHAELRGILQPPPDEFWSWHWTFKSTRFAKPQPLLGEARVTDLAVNVILPWLWVRAGEGRNEKLQREVERRFFAWPAAEDNSILKLARQRLLGTSNGKNFKTAAVQQGLMQIVRDFCEHANAVCDHCRFPELVREWTR